MDWLREIRLQKDLKQREVAVKAGFSESLYSHIETGRRPPRVAVAKKIAAVLDFDWTRFYEDEEVKN